MTFGDTVVAVKAEETYPDVTSYDSYDEDYTYSKLTDPFELTPGSVTELVMCG